MTIRHPPTFLAVCCILISISTLPVMAQVAYENGHPWSERAEAGPDAEVPGWYYNLGITGLRAELVADAPKELLVRYVFPKTPASGLVKIGDRIVGIGARMSASSVVAFIYTIPKRSLAITGKVVPLSK